MTPASMHSSRLSTGSGLRRGRGQSGGCFFDRLGNRHDAGESGGGQQGGGGGGGGGGRGGGGRFQPTATPPPSSRARRMPPMSAPRPAESTNGTADMSIRSR